MFEVNKDYWGWEKRDFFGMYFLSPCNLIIIFGKYNVFNKSHTVKSDYFFTIIYWCSILT